MSADDLLESLRAFWRRRRREVDERFHRTLPLADYVVDRWEKARELGFGEGSSIYDSSLVFGDVVVGENVWIGPFTVLDGSGGRLEIGAGSTIGPGAQVYTHDTQGRTLSGGEAPTAGAATRIGSNCHIGPGVVVAMGVTVGDRVAIGPNSVVLKDIPSDSTAFGVPCRVYEER
jgi:acetyltransferase-like isoleucine patch superfamily enzyme